MRPHPCRAHGQQLVPPPTLEHTTIPLPGPLPLLRWPATRSLLPPALLITAAAVAGANGLVGGSVELCGSGFRRLSVSCAKVHNPCELVDVTLHGLDAFRVRGAQEELKVRARQHMSMSRDDLSDRS
jgi:hypothetical protein